MSDTSTNLALPFLAAAQAQKHVTVNEALLRLDALVQLAVVSMSTTAQPGSPTDGQVYILPAGKTGTNWAGMTNWALAYYRDGVWEQITPREGFLAYVKDTDSIVAWSGAAWTTVNSANPRERLSAARTYYVRTDGSDSNNGLTNSSAGAFLTIQKAIDTAAGLDLGGYDVTIQIGNGTYTAALTARSLTGAGMVIVKGDETTPANVIVSTTSNTCFGATDIAGRYALRGLKLQTTTSGNCIAASGTRVEIEFQALTFGACAGNHVNAFFGAAVSATGNYTISGNAGVHLNVLAAVVSVQSRTVTLSGSPVFATGFAIVSRAGLANLNGNTFSGSSGASSPRYSATANGVIFTSGAATTYLPGDSAHATPTGTGGQYV